MNIGGWGTEGVIAVFLYLVYKDVIRPKFNKQKYSNPGSDRRKVNKNDKPGRADACIKHGQKLAILDTKVDGIKEDIRDLKRPGRPA